MSDTQKQKQNFDRTALKHLDTTDTKGPYHVSLSHSFVFLLLILSCLASYHVGTLVRKRILSQLEESETLNLPNWLKWAVKDEMKASCDPKTVSWIHCGSQEDLFCDTQVPRSVKSDGGSDDSGDDDYEALGQQLLADVSGMDQSSLLPHLLNLASSKGWTLKSHSCSTHSSATCFLLFQQGHYIALDRRSNHLSIFCAENEEHLLDWMDSLPLVSTWAYKVRGANPAPGVYDAGMSDLYVGLLGSLEYSHKRLIAKEQSPFQEVAIYEAIDRRYAGSQVGSSYATMSSQLFELDRQIYLDGVVQSRRHGERAYHEALVHPIMMAHPNPERVAIVGAGEGATLREVLKHSTLKQVIMIEIDSCVMNMSRAYLPEWNDCSDLILPEGMVNPTGNCFDDPRATVYAQDAIRWFMDRYPENGTSTEALFDVIIMDALDPGDKVEFSDMLFDNSELVASFHRGLSAQGIFGCQMGDEHHMDDPNPYLNRDRHSILFRQNLRKVGFERLLRYGEPSTRFDGLWTYLVASKAIQPHRWFANPAQIDLELRQRAIPTKSGAWPFHYYDGATHLSYQVANRAFADITCRMETDHPSCKRGPGLPQGGSNVPFLPVMRRTGDLVRDQKEFERLEECVYQSWDIPHNVAVLMDTLVATSSALKMENWKTFTFLFGSHVSNLGSKAKTVDIGNNARTHEGPSDHPYEFYAKGIDDPMMDRFWRIYECAARLTVHEFVPAGSIVGGHAGAWIPQ